MPSPSHTELPPEQVADLAQRSDPELIAVDREAFLALKASFGPRLAIAWLKGETWDGLVTKTGFADTTIRDWAYPHIPQLRNFLSNAEILAAGETS